MTEVGGGAIAVRWTGTRVLTALRTGYVYSLGLEEDTGWAEQFLAAFDRVIDER